MNKMDLINFLKENDIEEIQEIDYKEEAAVLRFFYDFDDAEIEAAKAYSKDECKAEEESEEWYNDFFLPYLTDLAIDNVGEIMEEAMEDLDIEIQYVSYELDKENCDYSEFIAVAFEKGKDIDIEDVLEEINV